MPRHLTRKTGGTKLRLLCRTMGRLGFSGAGTLTLVFLYIYSSEAISLKVVAQDGQSYRLTGGVSHSEALEPMDERDQVGKVFKGAGSGTGPGAGTQAVGKVPAGKVVSIGKPSTGAVSKTKVLTITKPPVKPVSNPVEKPITSSPPIRKPPPVPIFEITENRYQIPEWLAGTWQRSDATEVSRTELPSGKKLVAQGRTEARTSDKFGSYRDKDGRIWQTFKQTKAYGQTDRGTFMDYHRVSRWGLEIVGRSALVTVQAAHVIVNKKTRKVTAVFQDEEVNRYLPLADGKLRTESSVKVFNGNGDAVLQTRSVSNEVRTAPFKETQTR